MKPIPMKAQRGIAAVELAIVLPLLIMLLTVPIFYGLYFMHYTVAQKAAQSAARYMSMVPRNTMRTPALVAKATDAAENIVREMLADLKLDNTLHIEVQCDTWQCVGINPPAYVRVGVTFQLRDYILGVVETGDMGWTVTAHVTMKYAGQ